MQELVPVTLQEGALTTQYAKDPVEKLGLLKMDFLGLKNLTVIFDAEQHVRKNHNADFSIEEIPFDDTATFELLNQGNTVGVFQLESSGMRGLCRQIGLSRFEEIIAMIALYRPGPMQFIQQFVESKKDPSRIQLPHPLLEEVVRETYGILIYQEQVMESARIIAGYTLAGADQLRRAMGKKKKDEMEKQRATFIEGAARTNNINAKTAEEIFSILEKFAEYGFNKSHSTAYAVISYRTAYLKANYPIEFMAALLSAEMGDSTKVAGFIDECLAMRIPVLGPDVNESGVDFTPVVGSKPGIRFGLGAIKGVGESATGAVVAERESGGRFRSFADFVERMDHRVVGRRVIECLIRTGAFDTLGEDRGFLLANADTLIASAVERKKDKELGQGSLFDLLEAQDEGKPPAAVNLRETPPLGMQEVLDAEKELLGLYLSGHPLDRYGSLADALTTLHQNDLANVEGRTTFRICGVLSGVEKRFARKDNRPWVKFNIETRTANFPMVAFADTYERIADAIVDRSVVAVEGTFSVRNGETSMRVGTVSPLDSALTRAIRRITWVFRPDASSLSFLQRALEIFLNSSGSCEVCLAPQVGQRLALRTALPRSLAWRPNPEQFASLSKDPAVVGCHIVTREPEVQEVEMRWQRSDYSGDE